MADVYSPPGAFADISAFVADVNAINAATKTALKTAISNISALMGSFAAAGSGIVDTNVLAAHPDFNKVPPEIRALVQNELTVLNAAITAHA